MPLALLHTHTCSPAFLGGLGPLSGPRHNLGVGGWELISAKMKVLWHKPENAVLKLWWLPWLYQRSFGGDLGQREGCVKNWSVTVVISLFVSEIGVRYWRCAHCHTCGTWGSSLNSRWRTLADPSRKATGACSSPVWAESRRTKWHGRGWSGSLAGSALECCCAAVSAEPSTAEYRWCLFSLAPPPCLSFSCPIPVASNRLHPLPKHSMFYRYWQNIPRLMLSD